MNKQLLLPLAIPENTPHERLFKLSLSLISARHRVTEITKRYLKLAQQCEKELSDASDLLSEILASSSALHDLGSQNGATTMAEKKVEKKKTSGKKGATPTPKVETKKKK